MVVNIALGIVLAVVLLIVGLIVLANVVGFFGDLIEVHQIRRAQRVKWTHPEPQPYQTMAEWKRANPSKDEEA